MSTRLIFSKPRMVKGWYDFICKYGRKYYGESWGPGRDGSILKVKFYKLLFWKASRAKAFMPSGTMWELFPTSTKQMDEYISYYLY